MIKCYDMTKSKLRRKGFISANSSISFFIIIKRSQDRHSNRAGNWSSCIAGRDVTKYSHNGKLTKITIWEYNQKEINQGREQIV